MLKTRLHVQSDILPHVDSSELFGCRLAWGTSFSSKPGAFVPLPDTLPTALPSSPSTIISIDGMEQRTSGKLFLAKVNWRPTRKFLLFQLCHFHRLLHKLLRLLIFQASSSSPFKVFSDDGTSNLYKLFAVQLCELVSNSGGTCSSYTNSSRNVVTRLMKEGKEVGMLVVSVAQIVHYSQMVWDISWFLDYRIGWRLWGTIKPVDNCGTAYSLEVLSRFFAQWRKIDRHLPWSLFLFLRDFCPAGGTREIAAHIVPNFLISRNIVLTLQMSLKALALSQAHWELCALKAQSGFCQIEFPIAGTKLRPWYKRWRQKALIKWYKR